MGPGSSGIPLGGGLMKRASDAVLGFLIRFFHETLGMSPNQISVLGFIAGIAAAVMVAMGMIVPGLVVMAVSQIVDGLDGGVARRYNLQSRRGQMFEIVFDRGNELAIFLALAYVGEVSYRIVALAMTAILLVTWLEPKSKFDPGFKRFMIYFGYLVGVLFNVHGFAIALQVVFWANLTAFAVGTIMVDYRLQQEIDNQVILRRQREIALGIPQPPDDPPSFLSKLFS
jgi:phosphatidylglycerophosphate synthase